MSKVRKNIFEELDNVRKEIKVRFPKIEIEKLCAILGKLGTYHYNKKKFLILGQEKQLYNFLIENSYNPYTVYRWALLERIPEDIKFQLRNHFLSQKKVSKIFCEKRHETETKLQMDIKELGLKLIREV